MTHRFDFKAEMHHVYARLSGKFDASLVEQEQHRIRNAKDAVRGCEEAPQESDQDVES